MKGAADVHVVLAMSYFISVFFLAIKQLPKVPVIGAVILV
jgi:hypothetical protein